MSTFLSKLRRLSLALVLVTVVTLATGCGDTRDDFVFLGTTPDATPANTASQWNRVMQLAIIDGAPRPTVVSRSLYLVSAAMYDAWALYDSVATPSVVSPDLRRPVAEHTDHNQRAAVAFAAYHALLTQFPAYEEKTGNFRRLLQSEGFDTSPAILASTDLTTAQGLGRLAATSVVENRANDGSNVANNFVEVTSATYPALYAPVNSDDPTMPNSVGMGGFDANRWVPLRVPTGTVTDPLNPNSAFVDNNDPASYQTQRFLTPHWGAVRPFAMTSGSQFRPPAPPQAGSLLPYTDGNGLVTTNDAAYNTQVDEVLNVTANLTEREKIIAEYWADGPESTTPPGHWNQLALDISARDNLSVGETVKLLFALNGAVFDAGISAWDAKRHYDFIRPISAIRNKYFGQNILTWGGPGQNSVTRSGELWIPFQVRTFVTLAFDEYVSGHSTFSAAAAEVLRTYTGSDQLFDGSSVGYFDFDEDGRIDLVGSYTYLPGSVLIDPSLPSQAVELHWNTFTEAANEAGRSRIYGGIHFQDGDLRGRAMGRQIGELALQRARALWNGGAQ